MLCIKSGCRLIFTLFSSALSRRSIAKSARIFMQKHGFRVFFVKMRYMPVKNMRTLLWTSSVENGTIKINMRSNHGTPCSGNSPAYVKFFFRPFCFSVCRIVSFDLWRSKARRYENPRFITLLSFHRLAVPNRPYHAQRRFGRLITKAT